MIEFPKALKDKLKEITYKIKDDDSDTEDTEDEESKLGLDEIESIESSNT